MNTEHKVLRIGVALENLSKGFISAPRTDKLEMFAGILANEFSPEEVERGVQTIPQGERFPSLQSIKSAIYPHRKVKDNNGWDEYLARKIQDERVKAADALQYMEDAGFTKEDIEKYISYWMQECHGGYCYELLKTFPTEALMRPALLDLASANYKGGRAIQIGKERMNKIRNTKPESRQRAECY